MGVPLGKRSGNVFHGAASGVAAGSPFGVPGMVVGGIGGALIGGFSKSDAELADEARARRKQNYEAFKRSIEERRQKTLTEGSQKIGRLTSGLTSRFRDSAARRAAAMGRVGDVESFELPVVSQVANQGSNAMANFVTDTNQSYDRQSLAAEQAMLESENQYANDLQSAPQALDYLAEIAPAALQYSQNRDYLDVLKSGYGATQTPKIDLPPMPATQGYSAPSTYTAPNPFEDNGNNLFYNYVTGEWEPR